MLGPFEIGLLGIAGALAFCAIILAIAAPLYRLWNWASEKVGL